MGGSPVPTRIAEGFGDAAKASTATFRSPFSRRLATFSELLTNGLTPTSPDSHCRASDVTKCWMMFSLASARTPRPNRAGLPVTLRSVRTETSAAPSRSRIAAVNVRHFVARARAASSERTCGMTTGWDSLLPPDDQELLARSRWAKSAPPVSGDGERSCHLAARSTPQGRGLRLRPDLRRGDERMHSCDGCRCMRPRLLRRGGG